MKRAHLLLMLLLGTSAYALPDIKAEIVLSNPHELCDRHDKMDAPARAYRNASGTVHLIAAANINRWMTGPNLNDVQRDCHVAYQGGNTANESDRNGNAWIHGLYTADGQTVYALLHNEYWGHVFYPECKRNYGACWWNSVTWAASVDGGQTFQLPPPGRRTVLPLPYPYTPNIGRPVGFMNPSNIIQAGNMLYFMVHNMAYQAQPNGNYLLRKTVEAPWDQWEIWDGKTFSPVQGHTAGKPLGAPLDLGRLTHMPRTAPLNAFSLVRHLPSNLFVAVLPRGVQSTTSPTQAGFYISTSPDLIHWGPLRQLITANYRGGYTCATDGPQTFYRYASLLDPTSPDRIFSTLTGDKAYVYTTQLRVSECSQKEKETVLVRFPVTLNMKAETAYWQTHPPLHN